MRPPGETKEERRKAKEQADTVKNKSSLRFLPGMSYQ
jgi:hypothetical protein